MEYRGRALRSLALVGCVLLLLVVVAAVAEAAAADPGKALGKWMYDNIVVFFPPLIAIAALWYLARREFTTFVSFMIFAGLVAIMVYFPDSIKTAAKAIWDTAWGP